MRVTGDVSDTEYESYDEDDERHRESVYVNDGEQPISDHEDIPLPRYCFDTVRNDSLVEIRGYKIMLVGKCEK